MQKSVLSLKINSGLFGYTSTVALSKRTIDIILCTS